MIQGVSFELVEYSIYMEEYILFREAEIVYEFIQLRLLLQIRKTSL